MASIIKPLAAFDVFVEEKMIGMICFELLAELLMA
jgi:hypothetical protein